MAIRIEKRLIPRNFTPGRGREVEYLVIHFFGSLGSAAAVADYFARTGREASAHYCLDEGEVVYQCVEDGDIAWHCGTSGAYTHPACRNRNSIGIEARPHKLDPSTADSAAEPDWYFTGQVTANLTELTRALMERYGIPPERVLRHYDVTGKWCPRPWMGDDINEFYHTSGNEQWEKFKAGLAGGEEDNVVRYERLVSIPESCNFQAVIDRLMTAGIIGGDGSDPDGNGDVIDLSHDMVRMLMFNYRAGLYDQALERAGLDPAEFR